MKVEGTSAAAADAGAGVVTRQLMVAGAEDIAGAVASDVEDSEEAWNDAFEEVDVEDTDTKLVGRTVVDIGASWGAWRVDNMAGRRGEGACSEGGSCMSHHAAEEEAASASDVAYTEDDDFAAY